MHKAEEVLGFSFPAGVDAAIALEPGEEALDFPTPLVASELAPIDLAILVRGVLGRDQFDTLLIELVREFLAAEASVPDELVGNLIECLIDYFSDEDAVVSGSISDANGDRKTSAVCNRHDLRRIAGTASSDFGSPFLAPA